MKLHFILLCLLAAVCQSDGQTAGPPALAGVSDGDDRRSLKLVAAGEWSNGMDVSLAQLRTRILVYEGERRTNEANQIAWGAALVYLEIQDGKTGMSGPHTQIYFDQDKGLHFELRDANGASADNVKTTPHGGGSVHGHAGFWATVPYDGLVRLRADSGLSRTLTGPVSYPSSGGLNLSFGLGSGWTILPGDTNVYYLSATISPPPTNATPPGGYAWQGPLKFPAVKLTAPKRSVVNH